jgi:hypothetical protein
MTAQNKFTVQQRLSALEARCTGLEQENAALRTNLRTELLNAIADTAGATGAAGRAGADGAQGPQGTHGERGDVGPRGADGRKGDKGDPGVRGHQGEKGERGEKGDKGDQGLQGGRGDKGERGDVLYVGDAEMAAAVKAARRVMLEHRAATIAAIVQNIADYEKQGIVGAHFARLLASIRADIERLQ